MLQRLTASAAAAAARPPKAPKSAKREREPPTSDQPQETKKYAFSLSVCPCYDVTGGALNKEQMCICQHCLCDKQCHVG